MLLSLCYFPFLQVGCFLSFIRLHFTTRRHCPRTDAMAPSSLNSVVFLVSLSLLLSFLPSCTPESQREEEVNITPTVLESYDNLLSTNASSKHCGEAVQCNPGIILPVWKPNNPGVGDKVARAVVYFISLMYLFLGVSIIADRFMASIEVITSQVRHLSDCKTLYPIPYFLETTNMSRDI